VPKQQICRKKAKELFYLLLFIRTSYRKTVLSFNFFTDLLFLRLQIELETLQWSVFAVNSLALLLLYLPSWLGQETAKRPLRSSSHVATCYYQSNHSKVDARPYYKSKLELKSNSSKILPVNCKFICVHIFLFCAESQI